MNVLICDPISPKGIALFQSRPEFKVTVLDKPLKEAELIAIVKDVEAMVVRSETKVTRKVIEAAPKLRVVGRAGVGIDNVDVRSLLRSASSRTRAATASYGRSATALTRPVTRLPA